MKEKVGGSLGGEVKRAFAAEELGSVSVVVAMF